MIRSARSGSVKQKLNLENTKLKINIENLSSAISNHTFNENKLKGELEKYKEKLKRYKDKIKNKDQIIVKLLDRIQSTAVWEGSFDDLIFKLHSEHLKRYQEICGKGEIVNSKEIV